MTLEIFSLPESSGLNWINHSPDPSMHSKIHLLPICSNYFTNQIVLTINSKKVENKIRSERLKTSQKRKIGNALSDPDSNSEINFRSRSGLEIRFQIRIWNLFSHPDLEFNVWSGFGCWFRIRIQKSFSDPDLDLEFVFRSGSEICCQIRSRFGI